VNSNRTAHEGGAYGTDGEEPSGAGVSYACWTVYARTRPVAHDQQAALAEMVGWADGLAAGHVVLRGAYDVTGLRAGDDLMLWLHGPTATALQAALRRFRGTSIGGCLEPTFSVMGVHRPAEFSADHLPAFMLGQAPRGWLCVYPFARSYEWYLLSSDERREMLTEHGLAGRTFDVQANTVATFGLSDWEWIIALEADDPIELVDLIRALRATKARRHVREETPFYTGRLVGLSEAIDTIF
jgi:chlorite dismutase